MSLQVTAVPVHLPSLHRSVVVQTDLSSQLLPSGMVLWKHPVVLAQPSLLQALPSSQLVVAPETQKPLPHASPVVHALLSLQVVPSAKGVYVHLPVTLSHASVVQTSPSLQLSVEPGVHLPPTHVSEYVHALPSSHALPSLSTVFVHLPLTSQVSAVHRLLSLHAVAVPTHCRFRQASPVVQTKPSSHGEPSGSLTMSHMPPSADTQKSVVHGLPSLQTLAVPVHLPLWQASLRVQLSPSSQMLPLARGVKTQLPLVASQVSVVHALLSLQVAGEPAQTPAVHLSLAVHDLPSSQVVPSVTLVNTQLPVVASQVSLVQPLLSVQTLAVPPHLPLVQASLRVQARPSLQAVPLVTLVYTHAPVVVSQLSVVQALLSVQVLAVPLHLPVVQMSGLVQALLSLHELPSVTLLNTHLPVLVSHTSLVQGLLSLQTSCVPTHLPLAHASLLLQGLPSSQPVPLVTEV